MLRRFLLCFFLIFSLAFSSTGQGRILDDNRQVTPAVINVFALLKDWIQEKNRSLPSNEQLPDEELKRILESKSPSLEDLNTIAQRIFLRRAGVERVDILTQPEDSFLEERRKVFFETFKEIGDLDAVLPSQKTYNYILFNGSTVQNMRQRLATLVFYVEKGLLDLKGTQLVFLTGKRDLSEKEMELWKKGRETPKTEDEAARWIWNQRSKEKGFPKELGQLKPTFVVADKTQNALGEWVRPNTADTVKKWLESNPTPGSCLSVSSQPFVFYQQETIANGFKRAGREGFSVESVGDDSGHYKAKPGDFALLLDHLARTIYTVLESQKLEASRS